MAHRINWPLVPVKLLRYGSWSRGDKMNPCPCCRLREDGVRTFPLERSVTSGSGSAISTASPATRESGSSKLLKLKTQSGIFSLGGVTFYV